MSFNQITCEALQLNSQERAILAETIWESIEDPYLFPNDISDIEAIVLAKQRDSEIEKGNMIPLLHKELMDRLRK